MIIYRNLGQIDYLEAWHLQEDIFNRSIQLKMQQRTSGGGPLPEQHLLFCEHPHVYTIGKSGKQQNLLISDDFLKQIGATCYRVDRGGDITYHGPGQIVGYPIFDLEQMGMSVKEYVHWLESCIIDVLAGYGIEATRLEGATGVWLDTQTPRARKICAIGVRASRFVTMHGFALNVNTDLKYFSYINPCGFTDKTVTSMAAELKGMQDIREVSDCLMKRIVSILAIE
jgi:lipoyl(octanoyl) transferase